jgi:hypothetical protein
MMKTIARIYNELPDAYLVVQELIDSGVAPEEINLIAGDQEGQYGDNLEQLDMQSPKMGEEVEGAVTGSALGGIAGLLVGLSALTIPGIGPIIAAGPLISGFMGAIVGGLTGAIVSWGIPEKEAQFYSERIERGGALVIVRVPEDKADEVAAIIE